MLCRLKEAGLTEVTVHQEGSRVQVIRDGKLLMDLDCGMAVQLGKALHLKGLLAEEHAKRDQVVADQAVLLRAGAPFGVTSNPTLQKMAASEAAWNRDLRRYLPGGVKSEEMVGVPTVKHVPKES